MTKGPSVYIRLEAEAGQRWAPMVQEVDANASQCLFVHAPDDDEKDGWIQLQIIVPRSDTYYLWGRASGPSWSADSFYVEFDGGYRVQWGLPEPPGQPWAWCAVCDLSSGQCPNAYGWYLEQGTHTLTISTREAGAMLDAIEITDQHPNAYRPSWASPCP